MKPRFSSTPANRRAGVTLAEVVMSTLLVGILMTAALGSVNAAARSWIAASESADGYALARQLLDEIIVLPYEDANQTPSFGPEAGEVTAAGVRAGLDDLDDYNDWTDSPPKDRSGAPLAGYAGWSRTADTQKCNLGTYMPVLDNTADTKLRLATVTVTSPTGRVTILKAIRALPAGNLQPQGLAQTLILGVTVKLQAGNGAALSGDAALQNHASDQ